ncbi:MAG: endonuclease/exonuclease/phosphatase family protein [Luteolibacter sp.]|jgi:endonuclease/exonuclease/phosphatase family metal-dependent hydrolase|nr:endonuclease/exonuclease/phosphatase family protein [Luteolibacter sp.]
MCPRFSCRSSASRVRLTGGFALFAALLLGLISCDKNDKSPDWDTPGGNPPALETSSTARPAPPAAKSKKPVSPQPAGNSATKGLRFIAYNVENWLTMDRFVDHKTLRDSPKPESEKQEVVNLLASNTPDVIGLCEIGNASDLAEIQESLKTAGLDLPHSHYVGGSDPVRHLGLLSRFPIMATAKPAETDFRIKGRTFDINRGILDATLEVRGKTYRFLGVHLKSKRAVEDVDQEEMRIHEARLLRRHVDAILRANEQTRLVVYGDFNDTRPTKTFKTVTGSYNDPHYLTALPLKDSRGHAWTHHWALHDIYSRIDFITVSRALRPDVDFRASHIIDDPSWDKASDHRPVIAIFK